MMYDPDDYVAAKMSDRYVTMRRPIDGHSISIPFPPDNAAGRESWAQDIIRLMRIAHNKGRSEGADDLRAALRSMLGVGEGR